MCLHLSITTTSQSIVFLIQLVLRSYGATQLIPVVQGTIEYKAASVRTIYHEQNFLINLCLEYAEITLPLVCA